MLNVIWHLLLAWHRLRNIDSVWTKWVEHKGFRRAFGGRWGQWEFQWRRGGIFKMWLFSSCKHYPRPVGATSTEPLETEDYETPNSEKANAPLH